MTVNRVEIEAISGKEQTFMLQSVLLLVFCLFMGLVALAVCIWVVLTGRLFNMDGLLLVAISLAVGAFFMGNFAWSVHTGEVREVLNQLRGGSEKTTTHE